MFSDDVTNDVPPEGANTDEPKEAATDTATASAPAPAEEPAVEEHPPFYSGTWHDLPNYQCPYCAFSSLGGSGVIEIHILELIDAGDLKHTMGAYAAQQEGV